MGKMKLRDAVFHPDIVGYGVSDCGLRHGTGGDESAEFGLCETTRYREPLTLRQAVELKADIGDDATILAFFRDGRPDPEAIDLGCTLPIPRHEPRAVAWKRGDLVTDFSELRRGHLLISESMFHSRGLCRNLVEILEMPTGYELTITARFVDPADPNKLRAGANSWGFGIWPNELAAGREYYRALARFNCGEGVTFGQITLNPQSAAV